MRSPGSRRNDALYGESEEQGVRTHERTRGRALGRVYKDT